MRTIKLTHEEIALINEALGIAEHIYTEKFKELSALANVRGNEAHRSERQDIARNSYHETACKFADLNIEIITSSKDI